MEHAARITWAEVEELFLRQDPKTYPNPVVKGARALCFALQLYIQESHKTHFASIKSLSKMHNIQNFLLNHRQFLQNLPRSIDMCLEQFQPITPIQSLFLE